MPYPSGHRDNVRKKVIQSARRLFNRHGFEGVSVNQIMAAAGLTRGGFYSYFTSKSDLYVEALSCFFTDPNWKCTWKDVEIDLDAAPVGPQVIRAYLSRQHFENVEQSCPMVALPGDVARGGRKQKQAFEKVFRAMVGFLDHDVRNKDQAATAQAIAALCIGGMVIARAMDDRGLADELRDACMAVALQLGGWQEKSARAPLKSGFDCYALPDASLGFQRRGPTLKPDSSDALLRRLTFAGGVGSTQIISVLA